MLRTILNLLITSYQDKQYHQLGIKHWRIIAAFIPSKKILHTSSKVWTYTEFTVNLDCCALEIQLYH